MPPDDPGTAPHDELVRRSFAQQVPLFEGAASPFAQRPGTTLSWLEPLDAHMLVLDVACGAAHAAELAAPHVRQVVGVDLTRELLTSGAARLVAVGIDNVLLQEGNATELPFVDASFDLVICRSAVHHMADPVGAAREMARVCRPGGRVAVVDTVAPEASSRDLYDGLHRVLDPSHHRALLADELVALVQDAVGPLAHVDAWDNEYPFATSRIDERAMAPLRADMAGGAPTGFRPRADGDAIIVTFTDTAVQATRSSG